jgi:hypothetical protein
MKYYKVSPVSPSSLSPSWRLLILDRKFECLPCLALCLFEDAFEAHFLQLHAAALATGPQMADLHSNRHPGWFNRLVLVAVCVYVCMCLCRWCPVAGSMHVRHTWARAENYNCGQPGAAAWAWGTRDSSWDPHACSIAAKAS